MIEPLPVRPLALESPRSGLEAWACELARSARDIAVLEGALSQEEHRRAARFGRPELRDRYIVGRATLRALLGAKLALPPHSVVIARGKRGRPLVPNGNGLDFNVSHTSGMALIGMTSGCRIGVDIEHGERQLNVPGVARKFMSGREQSMLQALDDDARRRTLLRLWTCKEAMSKATGDALSAPFREIDVAVDTLSPRDGPPPYEPARWQLVALDVPGGFLATAALWHEHPSL
jgi:4'-phosphopantetheinyl transferase